MTTATIQAGIGQRTLPEGSFAGSPKRLARIAGLLDLAVGILGGFAFAAFVAPELTPIIHPVAALLGIVAEVSLLAYLLVKGVRDPGSTDLPSPVVTAPTPVAPQTGPA